MSFNLSASDHMMNILQVGGRSASALPYRNIKPAPQHLKRPKVATILTGFLFTLLGGKKEQKGITQHPADHFKP